MPDQNHPLWATVRFCALCVACTFVLWKNASNFDETEIKAILEIAIMAGGYEGIATFINHKKVNSNGTIES